jgi:eukaryotic-like serine/threonine-protein kinase
MADVRGMPATDRQSPEEPGRDSDDVPERVGPYRVLQLIAEGGMGVVYDAEQLEPVRRRVALKVIKPGMDTREVIARFAVERQALAVMDHPGIAKVLDGGVTDDGRPYFVMEMVRGIPITDFCDVEKLPTRDRLRLFVEVCHAVQHAHQKGVIHRDLKPSNILVALQDGEPVPKVIDFGIAKALSQQLTDRTLATRIGQTIGTPAYMSPEQADASGIDIDTRADVYSLGVVLFELLVGRLPLDPTEIGMPAFMMRLMSRDTNVSQPSAKLATLGDAALGVSHLRRTEPRALKRELKGDLDWIVMKAIEPDRSRRYETVNALAMDIGRYLASEPVAARPPSTTYRFSRFVRRNRIAVAAAAAVLLALVGGLSAAAVGFVRARSAEASARREAATAQQVVGFLTGLFKVSDPSEARGNTVTAREILDRGAERVRTDLADEPLVQAEMLTTIGTVYRELGLYNEAQPLLEQALAIRRRLLAPDDSVVQASATALAELAMRQGRYAVAESLYDGAVASVERVQGDSAPALAPALGGLAGVLLSTGRYAAAESTYTRAIAIHSMNGDPQDARLASLLQGLGLTQISLGHPADAEPNLQRALAIYQRVEGPDGPNVGRVLSNLGVMYWYLGRYDDAAASYEKAEPVLVKTLGPSHRDIATININLGEIEDRRGNYAAALARLHRALDILHATIQPGNPSFAIAYDDLGTVLCNMRQYREAESYYKQALQIDETALGPDSHYVATFLGDYAKLLRKTGRVAEAEEMEQRAAAIRAANAAQQRRSAGSAKVSQ